MNLHHRVLRPAVCVLVGVPILAAVPAAAGAADDAAGDAEYFAIDRTVVEFAGASPDLPQGTAASRTGTSALVDFENRPEMLIIDTDGAEATFAVRSLNEGVWSEWVEVETPFDEAPDGVDGEEGAGSVSAIGPIWLGDNAENAEIQLVSGAASSVTVEALDSTDDRAAAVLESAIPEGMAASTPVGRPAIQPRSAWATSGWRFDNSGCENGPSHADNIRTVVVHHTVTTNSYAASQVDDILRGIYRTHTAVNGWCDIAYNFVVDRFGTIWEARSGGTDRPVIGGHSKGFNTWTAGVALLGQHHSGASPAAAAPTAAAVAAVNAVASWKLSLHGVDPLGRGWLQNRSTRSPLKFPAWAWVEIPAIVGHGDLGHTSCPGSLTVPSISGMRSTAAKAHNSAPPHVAAARAPAAFGPAFVTVAADGGLRAAGAAANVSSASVESGLRAVAVAGIAGKGQILRSDGSLRAFGGAAAVSAKPAGTRSVVDIAVETNGGAGWVLDSNGFIFRFGGAPERSATTKPSAGRAVGMALTSDGRGYVVDASGGLHAVGGSPKASIGSGVTAVDIALRTSSSGWVLDSSGRLHPFGGAPNWQPERSVGSPRAIVTGGTYGGWVVDSEGRYVRFGDERRIQPISTTVGTPTAVDAAVIGWELGTADADMKYAAALTSLFLGSSATARISDHVAFRAVELGSPRVVAELAQSPEWAGALLAKMYNDVLGRDPDPGGQAYWLAQLRRGLRTQDLGALFYASPEYVEQAGSTDAWLRQLYRALLHREPDAGGFAYWKSRLAAGMTPPAVTAQFYQSPESRQDRVTALYQQILRRNPEPAGLSYWAERLFTIDDIRLAVELAVSAEYYNLVT